MNEKIDVWSFGTLLWEMYTGEVPWKTLVSPVQVIFAVAVQHARLPVPQACPPALRLLMRRVACCVAACMLDCARG